MRDSFYKFENFTDIFSHRLILLNSHEDFERWFLQRNDYTWCYDEKIHELIEECRPTEYPCIPLVSPFSTVMLYIKPETVSALSGVVKSLAPGEGAPESP